MGKQFKDSAYVHVSDLSLTIIKLSYDKSVTPWWNSEYLKKHMNFIPLLAPNKVYGGHFIYIIIIYNK